MTWIIGMSFRILRHLSATPIILRAKQQQGIAMRDPAAGRQFTASVEVVASELRMPEERNPRP
jgi:hypothetical protein